jgi:hypothetical protein
MDIEERTRLAVALVPKPGIARHGEALYVTSLGVFVWGALHVLRRYDDDPTLTRVGAVIALLALGVVLLTFTIELLNQSRMHRLAVEWVAKGNLERGAEGFFALLERRWVFVGWRASYATSLATAALMASHPERAMVLLRAVTASETMPRLHRATLRDRTALTLLALGRVVAARAMLAEPPEDTGSWVRRVSNRGHIVLLIDALCGNLEAAVASAEAAEERFRLPAIGSKRSGAKERRSYGWLVIAYVWERVVRSKSGEARLDFERRRDEAIAQARDVPPHYYRYLAFVAPDFVAFADRFARSS